MEVSRDFQGKYKKRRKWPLYLALLCVAIITGGLLTDDYEFIADWFSPELVYKASSTGVAEAAEIVQELEMPILERIKKAESDNNQFCTEELAKSKKYDDCFPGRIGLPLMNVNVDGTIDWGICQINDYHWGKKARELGYDIMTLEGNEAMCEWLFLNHGTEPWGASKKGWN